MGWLHSILFLSDLNRQIILPLPVFDLLFLSFFPVQTALMLNATSEWIACNLPGNDLDPSR
jgi:hypothetical protein